MISRVCRFSLVASLVGLALVPSAALPAQAQDSSAVAAPAGAPDALAGLRGSELRPGSWTYASTVTRGGESVELARRTLTVAEAEHEGRAAWLILDETQARGQAMTDSLLVSREELRPLRRVADMGPMRIVLAFPGDSVTGTMSVPAGGDAPVALSADGRRVVVNSGMLEAALTLLPLRAGWTATVTQFTPSPVGATLVPVTLSVEGEETLTLPVGQFDTWVLTASAAGGEQRLWVAKDSGRLVQQEATPPHASDVVYRTTLVATGAAR